MLSKLTGIFQTVLYEKKQDLLEMRSIKSKLDVNLKRLV